MSQREKIIEALRKNIDWTDDNGQLPELADAIREALKEGSEAVGYIHTMDNTEGIESNKPWIVFSFSKNSPFGVPGVDFDESYPVTSEPVFYLPPDAQAIIAQKDAESRSLSEIATNAKLAMGAALLSVAELEAERDALRKVFSKSTLADNGFHYDIITKVHTPTVTLRFTENDWDSRDAFVEVIAAQSVDQKGGV